MILLDDDDDSGQGSSKLAPSTHPTVRLPEPVAGRSSLFLPDYETSQAQQQHSAELRKPTPILSFPHRFDSRFWRGTFFALAIYVFLSVVIGIPLIVTRIAYRKRPPPPNPNPQSLFLDDTDQAALPLTINPSGAGQVMATSPMTCGVWDSMNNSGPYYSASVQNTLDPSGLISVRSNATDEVVPRAGGKHNLTVDFNDNASETQVVMSMTLTASSQQLRDSAQFCFSTIGEGRGYSIYFPQTPLAPEDYLGFDIRVLFPQSSQHISLTDFITYLPMFHQYFGSLSPSVRINNINLAGAGVDIICDSLSGDKIAVTNSFASLSGTFNLTQSIALDNIEGSIHTNVTLNNDPSTGAATYLVADTGNSDIVADVTMVGSSSSQVPHFYANVRTFNGSLTMNVAHDAATPPAALNLQVANNQAPSRVSLDSKFTGSFDLRTKLGPAYLHYSPPPSSSSTQSSQQWHVEIDADSTSSSRGWVGYGTRPQYPAAQVALTSSLSPVWLYLGT